MVKRFILIAASIVLPVCLILTSCRQGAGKKAEDVAQEATEVTEEEDLDIKYAAEMLTKGTQAPSFTLKDINGNDVSLEAFKGKYVVLDFWASWCPDCRKDVPAMKALCEKYSSDKVAFLGVSFDTDKDQWTGFVKENGMEWTHVSPIIKWKESQVSQDYKVNWIPSMYLIDPDGKIVFGTVVLEKLEKTLASL